MHNEPVKRSRWDIQARDHERWLQTDAIGTRPTAEGGSSSPSFLEAPLVNNFAIRYTKRKGVKERDRMAMLYRGRREVKGVRGRERMTKIGEEGRRMERKGVGWLSECDLGREFTMQYQ